MGVRLFIEQHMPELEKELPLIADALEMRGLGNLVDTNADLEGDKDESIFATISLLKETLSTFEEALDSITETNISICKERMQALCHQLRSVISPPVKGGHRKGSIRNLQQNVTLNRFGNKRSTACSAMNVEDIGVPPTNKDKGTRRLGWGIQGSRKRVRLPKLNKLKCMHCNCRVLILGKNQTSHCNHCDSMLPLHHHHCDISTTLKTLKGQTILIDDGVECITSATIVDVHYPDGVGERWFTIVNNVGVSLTNIYASKVRILAT